MYPVNLHNEDMGRAQWTVDPVGCDVQVSVTVEKAVQLEAFYNRPQHVALKDIT